MSQAATKPYMPKPGELVLVRSNLLRYWQCHRYSHYVLGGPEAVTGRVLKTEDGGIHTSIQRGPCHVVRMWDNVPVSVDEVIPLHGNESILDTTDDPIVTGEELV